jgi:hypothetical protein
MATEAKQAAPQQQTPATLAQVAAAVKDEPKAAETKLPALVEGKTALITSAVGRLIHPFQVPLEFNLGVITPVKVDRWVIIQYEAGKLKLADPV